MNGPLGKYLDLVCFQLECEFAVFFYLLSQVLANCSTWNCVKKTSATISSYILSQKLLSCPRHVFTKFPKN